MALKYASSEHTEKFYALLAEKYPQIKTAGAISLDVHFGWHGIIAELFAGWADVLSLHNYNSPAPLTVSQIKEKWGELRVYYELGTQNEMVKRLIGRLLERAEVVVRQTCKVCGSQGPGTLTSDALYWKCLKCHTIPHLGGRWDEGPRFQDESLRIRDYLVQFEYVSSGQLYTLGRWCTNSIITTLENLNFIRKSTEPSSVPGETLFRVVCL